MKFWIFFIALFFTQGQLCAQVQMQNGAFQASFPLFKYSDDRHGLTTSISLQYTAGNGIKVNDLATDVGLGWAIGAGGFIQRVQIGEADDQYSGDLFPIVTDCNNDDKFANLNAFEEAGFGNPKHYIDNYFPNGYLYSEFSIPNPNSGNSIISNYPNNCMSFCSVPAELSFSPRFKNNQKKAWKFSRRALTDRTQDIFLFNFNGRAGSFIIGKDKKITLLPDSKLDITFTESSMIFQGIRTKINQFVITDESGISYKFSQLELAEVMTVTEKYRLTGGSFDVNVSTGQPTGKYTVQKWMLSEIENKRSQAKIIFTYRTDLQDVVSGYHTTFNDILTQRDAFNVFEQRIRTLTKRVEKISFSDGVEYQFYYSSLGVVNQPYTSGYGLSPLSSIRKNQDGVMKSQWNFNYKYFYRKQLIGINEGNSKTADERRYLRLCLKSIQEIGIADKTIVHPIIFDYYTGSESTDPRYIVPPTHSFAQDYFGYYTTAYADKDLNTLIIPTDVDLAPLMFNFSPYPQNRYPTDGIAKLGILKSIKYPSGGLTQIEYEQRTAAKGIPSKEGGLNRVGGVRVSKITNGEGESDPKKTILEYSYQKADGTSSGWGFEPIQVRFQRDIRFLNDQGYSQSGDQRSEYSKSVWGWLVINVFQTQWFQVAMDIVSFASMLASPDPVSVIISAVLKAVGVIIDAVTYDKTYTAYQNSFYPLATGGSVPILYSRVQEKNNSPGINNGHMIYEYTSPKYYNPSLNDDDFQFEASSFPYSNRMRYAQWKYGLIYKVTSIAANGVKVKEAETFYNTSILENRIVNSNNLSVKVEPYKFESAGYFQVIPGYGPAPGFKCATGQLTMDFYYPITGRVEVSQTKTRTFNQAGQFSEVEVNYTYNPKNYQPSEVVTKASNGEIIGEKIYYSCDFTKEQGGMPYKIMDGNNIINYPVCRIQWKKASINDSKKVISVAYNLFDIIGNGDVKLSKVYATELEYPISSSITETMDISNLIFSYPFLKHQKTLTYSSEGNLECIEDKGTKNSSTLFDYSGRYAIAQISNAKITDGVAYTSFEADGNHEAAGIGKWGYGQHMIRFDGSAVTGKKVYDLEGSLWINSLNPQKRYIITYWSKGALPGLNINFPNGSSEIINSQIQLLKNSNGWYLCKAEFQGATGVGIWKWNTNMSLIDEVRVYPYDSRMSTVTYDSHFGKTSECDINNRVIHYQYDPMGRLLAVLDENRNILKVFEYNQPKFGNDEMSADFTKSCYSYQIGNVVTYTVPANTYYSSSKEEANLLAQNDISVNGQNYANNGPIGVCTTIYARMEVTNWVHFSSYGYADVAIRFYSDQYCTQALSVSNLPISFTEYVDEVDYNGNSHPYSYTNNDVANGYEYLIGNSLMYDNAFYNGGSLYRNYNLNDLQWYIRAY